MKKDFGKLASEKSINKTKDALEKNGIKVFVVENGAEAKEKALQIIPAGVEIMTMSSVTVDSIGLAKEINESGKYNPVRKKFATMDAKTQGQEMKKLGAAPKWVTGSVHAVTEDGKVIVVSATGSQLPAYAYGSSNVVWVVGSQKIVRDLDEGMRRIEEYVFPLENERAKKVYGGGSSINKILIFNKEGTPARITMIIVKEKLGF
ncbi:MAG: LUD domain-containing protein [Candidatus Staskawiczbacteria bacterium]|nr:LUD domain-containing protein [Candidatus Staskawiczbacteria bacterium]